MDPHRLVIVIAGALLVAACGDDDNAPLMPKNDGGVSPVDAASPSDAAPGTSGTWTAKKPLPKIKQELGVVALGGKVYVLGGADDKTIFAEVDVYDPKTDTWSTAAPLPKPLHHINASVVNGRIWITGALEAFSFTAVGDTYVYDPATNTWTQKASMIGGSERGASFVGAIGDVIYVAGGIRGGTVADVSAYDTAGDRWSALPPLPVALDHGCSAVVNGVLYAIGGRGASIGGHTTRVDALDPKSGAWLPRAPMPTSRAGAACAVVKDKVVVAGGEGNPKTASGVFAEVEVFDPATNAWTSLPPMRTPRHGTAGATVDDIVYVPGGATKQGFGAVSDVEALTF